MGKIRPKRIVEGFAKKLLPKEEIAKQRHNICLGCPLLKSELGLNTCGVCGCEVDAKSNVMDEYCPKNKWEDIKICEDTGIAVRVVNPNQASIELVDGVITVTYKEPFKHGSNALSTKLVLEIINARGDFDFIPKNQRTLTDMTCSICSCFATKLGKDFLRDGQSTEIELIYNTQLSTKDISKKMKVISAQDVLYITVKAKMDE